MGPIQKLKLWKVLHWSRNRINRISDGERQILQTDWGLMVIT